MLTGIGQIRRKSKDFEGMARRSPRKSSSRGDVGRAERISSWFLFGDAPDGGHGEESTES